MTEWTDNLYLTTATSIVNYSVWKNEGPISYNRCLLLKNSKSKLLHLHKKEAFLWHSILI